MHINSPPVASKRLWKKIWRNYFGFNSDKSFSYKRPTVKHWLQLDEAFTEVFLACFKCVKPEGTEKCKSKEIISMYFFINLVMMLNTLK